VITPAIANLIRENKIFRITSAIQTGQKLGMQLLDDHMFKLWKEGKVEKRDILLKAHSVDELNNKIARHERGMFEDEDEALSRTERTEQV
jgi:twitching motility protein PilT